jgi:hypothetical protein
MTIGQAADEISTELGYNSIDKKPNRRNIIARMDMVRSELMSILINSGTIQSGQTSVYIKRGVAYDFPDVFYISRLAPLVFDATQQKYYSEMPTGYVAFGSNNGIRMVKPKHDRSSSTYFISQMNGASVSFANLESAALGGMIGYEVEGQRIYYNNMPANQYTEVLITYIPTLMALTEEDALPCTGDFASILLDKTRDSFLIQLQRKEDKTIDSTSND